MPERHYVKGLNQMNYALAYAVRKDRPVNAAEVARHIGTTISSALYYLHQLTTAKRLQREPWKRGVEGMTFSVLDATPIPLPEPVVRAKPPKVPRVRKERPIELPVKRPSMKAIKAPSIAAAKNVAQRRVIHKQAEQIGMVRDALVAALFGAWKAA
ncbi:FaeA/PapI family transcriptional regulator [Massilia endophytica]|uniref:FaeA/PapI family transcriptional regulator n=1 Tax=Massilia endophytica TaxID=2899220 RepID=UPI001E49B866|nr:FaeA/PapI family transcriptional regulator [Massilia endophytica]UGQ44955.1 FaeA/PapI family transcriptional regulator [Massilia endophytica]